MGPQEACGRSPVSAESLCPEPSICSAGQRSPWAQDHPLYLAAQGVGLAVPAAGVGWSRPPEPFRFPTIFSSLTDSMSSMNRCSPGTCKASYPATTVISLCMGWWAQHPPATANAQHRGDPGGRRAHTEGRHHTLWAPHPVGGEQVGSGPGLGEGRKPMRKAGDAECHPLSPCRPHL